jgi:hypothetical protein
MRACDERRHASQGHAPSMEAGRRENTYERDTTAVGDSCEAKLLNKLPLAPSARRLTGKGQAGLREKNSAVQL